MCYYTGRKLKKVEVEALRQMGMQLAFLNDDLAIHKGFDYNLHPVIRPVAGTRATEIVNMNWGFLPSYLSNMEAVRRFRNGYKDEKGWHKGYITLNATSEELLNKMYKDAALHRRCLVPANYFYEWMHVQVVGKSGKLLKTAEKFPYKIEIKEQPEFYMAGIWQPWTDRETGITMNTFAIVTTVANTLMKQIHNIKERMPTILPGDLAEAWLYKDLTDQEILDIANYQIASAEMKATPLDKNFLKKENPHEEILYNEVRALSY